MSFSVSATIRGRMLAIKPASPTAQIANTRMIDFLRETFLRSKKSTTGSSR